ncbi:MAG TPA: PHP domain-containing protein [Bacteroidota bacterium]
METKADLHLHTTYSDGALSPYELIKKARGAGLDIISITDHDSVGAIEEAVAIGKEFDLEVIPGMELSANLDQLEVHILGYFMDYRNKSLLESLAVFREKRLRRAERIVGKLNRMNIPLNIETVLANAAGNAIGRPHIATAMVNEGHAESYRQAFSKYLGDGRPAYERKEEFSPEETVRLIASAGGLSFLAHPGRSLNDTLLARLIDSGLDGIEVIHPSHTPELVSYYRGIVNEYCLMECGGSDFHGGLKGDDEIIGRFGISSAAVDIMRRRLFAN